MIDINKPYVKKPTQYAILPEIVKYLIKKTNPKMIILFGSCSRGVITNNSDIDLCIVVEKKIDVKARAQIRSEFLSDILEITDFDVDLLICDLEEWKDKQADPGTFIGKIQKEGKLLYGR